jgi:hypothetical protein
MSVISIIILAIMLLLVVISFWVLFSKQSVDNVVVVPSYKNVSILKQNYKNDGERMTQEKLLENTDYILNAMQ